ncbi:MAG: phenylalanine--tRNA ligase subunit alpha [Oscillospiraceae bacterium]|jgi:phenylalanyl-tRNA synthetase alpha chain|nr:phenylalanine--tRNA ligase subunit alpha [Oscillospiraceae bacterium]
MKETLEALQKLADSEISAAHGSGEVENLRVRFLGKKGELTKILKQMGRLSDEERPVIGAYANEVRNFIENLIQRRQRQEEAAELAEQLKEEELDVTLPGRRQLVGHRHPMSIMQDDIKDVFIGMGFEIIEGPEIDKTYYNFTALNTPESHPSRDWQDTFYFSQDVVLRTQTSSVQARILEAKQPPIRAIAPGRVYRKDEVDATHSPMFHQIEGLIVDKGITMADLKGTLNTLFKHMYGEDAKTRFRPHHFPFTEPSAEVDLQCFSCGGEGCRICKGEGWIEMLGCGMVHPNVLRMAGIDPEVYSGWAFGLGTDRMTSQRFGVSDLRIFFENDIRFLSQF